MIEVALMKVRSSPAEAASHSMDGTKLLTCSMSLQRAAHAGNHMSAHARTMHDQRSASLIAETLKSVLAKLSNRVDACGGS